MKKIFLTILTSIVALAAFADSETATATVSVDKVYIKSGKSVVVPVNVDASELRIGIGGVMDLVDGITLTDVTIGDILTSTHTPAFSNPSTNYYKYAITSSQSKYWTAKQGVLFYLTLADDGTHTVGQKFNASLRELELGNGVAAQAIHPADVTFEIEIVEDKLDLYDDAAAAPATSTDTENVILHRKTTAGIWNTFCVPFDMNAAQIEEAFGTGAEVAEFTTWTADDKDEATEITLSFTSVTAISANVPYIVKPTVSATYADGLSITGVNGIDPDADAGAVEIKVKFGTKNRTFGFYGVFVPTVLNPDGDAFPIYLKNNKFYYAAQNTTLKGYRAYFNNDDTIISSLFEVKMCVDEDPTAIESIDAEFENGMAYTVDGKFVGKNVNLNRMQKGVYIVNGKKVINK